MWDRIFWIGKKSAFPPTVTSDIIPGTGPRLLNLQEAYEARHAHRLFSGLCSLKTPLPRTGAFTDERKIWEMAKRGGFTLNAAGRQELHEKIRKGNGGIWLELTLEQYAKLRGVFMMTVTVAEGTDW